MDDAGLQGLLSTLLARHLRRLNLTHTAVTDDGVRHLQGAVHSVLCKRCPGCAHSGRPCLRGRGASPTGFPLLRTVLLDYSLVTPACLLVLNGTVSALWTDYWGRRVYRVV